MQYHRVTILHRANTCHLPSSADNGVTMELATAHEKNACGNRGLRQRDFLVGPANGPDWPPNWSSGFLARNHANAGDCDAVLSGHSRSVLAQFGLTPKSKHGLAASEGGEVVDPLDGV